MKCGAAFQLESNKIKYIIQQTGNKWRYYVLDNTENTVTTATMTRKGNHV